MAYINSREVLFSPVVNGVLDNEALQQADIYKKIFANEPLDLVVPDGVTVLCEEQNIMYAPTTTVKASGADVEEITGEFFAMTNVESIDFPKLKIINNEAFRDCSSLTEINAPVLTTIGDKAFNSCTSLTKINLPMLTTIGTEAILNTPKIVKMTVGALTSTDPYSFKQPIKGYNGSLTVLEVGNGTSADLYLQYSNKYTQATLHAIIENLADLSERETAGNFVVGSTNLDKIDDEHKTMLRNKNWNYE